MNNKTIRKQGTYGFYGIRKNKNKFEARVRKTISGITKDFTGRGITEKLAITDLDKKILSFIKNNVDIEKNMTVTKWCEQWLKEKRILRSYSYYESIVRRYILPVLGNRKLITLKLKDLQEVINKMATGELSEGTRRKNINPIDFKKSKKGLSKSTMSKVKNTMCQIFQYAVDNKYMEQIPFKSIKIPNVKQKEKLFLTASQENILVNYLLHATNDASLMLLLQDYRGLRASEVCGIKWQNIDFENRKIYIRQGVQRIKQYDENGHPTKKYKLQETPLKTDSSKRDIVMNDIIYSKFKIKYQNYTRNCLKYGILQNANEFVFKTSSGSLYDCKTLEKDLYKILNKLSLPQIGTHQLRHLFCTRLADNNIHPRVAQELMGHADISTTMKIYTKVRESKKVEAIKKIDESYTYPSPIAL